MSARVRRVFVSYSHHDADLATTVFVHLGTLDHFFPVEVWIDQHKIGAGNQWRPEIEEALAAADLAVLLISPQFLNSPFIRDQELPRLRERYAKGLPLVPIQLRPCERPEWLKAMEMLPRGEVTLAEIREPATVDRKLQEVVREIAKILAPETVPSARPEVRGEQPPSGVAEDGSVRLLTETLIEAVPDESRVAFAAKLVQEIRRYTALSGDGLFNAVRFFIEYQILRSDEPTSPTALMSALVELAESELTRALINRLRQSGRTGDFSGVPLEANSRFFSRTNDRAPLWKKYFDAVVRTGVLTKDAVVSIASVKVTTGFVSPQFLVAGLLSRLNDDWRPVLSAYQRAIPHPRQRPGAFESLQASQWNCWLMWGPSIPVCQCEQWHGFFALQYGYGDENNSIPVLELVADDSGGPKTLGPIVATLNAEGRGAKFTALTGRLRWGPWFLEPHAPTPAADVEVDIGCRDADPEDPRPERYGIAPVQASLYDERGPAHRQASDSLVLQLERVDESLRETRVYFSAYLWVMFLVAVPTRTSEEAEIGPRLLRGKHYPPWPARPEDRKQTLEARLWEDLLPVFVHANIGDPAALRFQKHVVVRSALHLLRQVWDRRGDLFDGEDVRAGIKFHLVCASDYSGCGCAIRFPSQESLIVQLGAALAEEGNRDFAESVILPNPDGNEPGRPWGLAGYFSACHLPELIADYYEHVSQVHRSAPRP